MGPEKSRTRRYHFRIGYAGRGLASGFKEPHWNWSVEKFYHHWFQSDSEMLGIIRELGLEDKVIFPRPLTVMYHKKKWYPFDFGTLKMGSISRLGLGGKQNPLRICWVLSTPHEQLACARKGHCRSVDVEICGQASLRADVEAASDWEVWALSIKTSTWHGCGRVSKPATTRPQTSEGGFQKFADTFADKLREGSGDLGLG